MTLRRALFINIILLFVSACISDQQSKYLNYPVPSYGGYQYYPYQQQQPQYNNQNYYPDYDYYYQPPQNMYNVPQQQYHPQPQYQPPAPPQPQYHYPADNDNSYYYNYPPTRRYNPRTRGNSRSAPLQDYDVSR